tara:strand:- start:332 stop:550 length:219 start_codon:yes stop_codon:yes gene_type:complete
LWKSGRSVKPFSRALYASVTGVEAARKSELPEEFVREIGGFVMNLYLMFIEVDPDNDRLRCPNKEWAEMGIK